MRKFVTILAYIIIAHSRLKSQVFPKEGSILNYRLIGFSFPETEQENNCKLEIAAGMQNTDDSFKRNIITTLDCKTNRIIAEVPAFGRQYTWRITDARKKTTKIEFYHFGTTIIPNVDTSITRLRILKKTEAYKDDYVFIDGTRTLYDMNGQPVWYFPNIEHFQNEYFEVRDMKITPQGTITFIIGEQAYEVDYNASILWKAPQKIGSGDENPGYHHEITRLSNGHYMILGNENVLCRQPSSRDGSFVIIGDDSVNHNLPGDNYIKVPLGTIMEYDEKGNLVWLWRSLNYFKRSDIIYHKRSNGIPEITPHENGFYFDEKTKNIYVSFRNISRILKVKYPEGNVINTYGEIYKEGIQEKGNGLFCHQHSCKVSDNGYLYLFNNNVCNVGALPTIIMLQEPVNDNGSLPAGQAGLKKIWEYECTIDGINDSEKKASYQFVQGGNVIELPGHSIFASMNAPYYSKVFIVNMNKEILWSAIPERKNPANNQWNAISLYEASIISSREELEHLIWNAEKAE